jgi:hypothetical protein
VYDFTFITGHVAALTQATSGEFYGITYFGGTDGLGMIYALSVGLGPFVETQPRFGKVGSTVKILGTNLDLATGVTFKGTPAAFTVASSFLISTTVPQGATTGRVQVTLRNGTLTSNLNFRVLP